MARQSQRAARERSRKVREAAIGTHVANTSRSAQRSRMNLGDHRMGARASRSELSQVMPSTSSRESMSSHARRRARTAFAVQDARRSRRRGYYVLAAVLLLAVVVALLVTRCTFGADVTSRMALADSDAIAALAVPESEEEPFYTLFLGEYRSGGGEYHGPSLIMLARIDPVGKVVTFISVPTNIQVELSDKQTHILSEAQTVGGDAELIAKINDLFGVQVAHIAKVDDQGFVKVVDALGGITVDVPQEVDDPDAGTTFMPAGEQKLNGAEALTLCRADNYVEPVSTQARAQANTLAALLSTMSTHTDFDFVKALDSVAPNVKTDLNADQVTKLFGAFEQAPTIYATTVPGYMSVEVDGTYFQISEQSLIGVMEAVNDGLNPNDKGVRAGVDPAQVTVTVRNGAGVTGMATTIGEILQGFGYQVVDMGNADAYVYDETLVVYNDEQFQPAAQDIVDQLGGGRTVEAGIYYTFDTDLLVVIGKDWKPMT